MADRGTIDVKSLTAKKVIFDTYGDIGLGVNFYRTDTAIISAKVEPKINTTGTTRLPLTMVTAKGAVIKDKTTRIKQNLGGYKLWHSLIQTVSVM